MGPGSRVERHAPASFQPEAEPRDVCLRRRQGLGSIRSRAHPQSVRNQSQGETLRRRCKESTAQPQRRHRPVGVGRHGGPGVRCQRHLARAEARRAPQIQPLRSPPRRIGQHRRQRGLDLPVRRGRGAVARAIVLRRRGGGVAIFAIALALRERKAEQPRAARIVRPEHPRRHLAVEGEGALLAVEGAVRRPAPEGHTAAAGVRLPGQGESAAEQQVALGQGLRAVEVPRVETGRIDTGRAETLGLDAAVHAVETVRDFGHGAQCRAGPGGASRAGCASDLGRDGTADRTGSVHIPRPRRDAEAPPREAADEARRPGDGHALGDAVEPLLGHGATGAGKPGRRHPVLDVIVTAFGIDGPLPRRTHVRRWRWCLQLEGQPRQRIVEEPLFIANACDQPLRDSVSVRFAQRPAVTILGAGVVGIQIHRLRLEPLVRVPIVKIQVTHADEPVGGRRHHGEHTHQRMAFVDGERGGYGLRWVDTTRFSLDSVASVGVTADLGKQGACAAEFGNVLNPGAGLATGLPQSGAGVVRGTNHPGEMRTTRQARIRDVIRGPQAREGHLVGH